MPHLKLHGLCQDPISKITPHQASISSRKWQTKWLLKRSSPNFRSAKISRTKLATTVQIRILNGPPSGKYSLSILDFHLTGKLSFAVFLCLQCAGTHRGYGVHVRFVMEFTLVQDIIIIFLQFRSISFNGYLAGRADQTNAGTYTGLKN